MQSGYLKGKHISTLFDSDFKLNHHLLSISSSASQLRWRCIDIFLDCSACCWGLVDALSHGRGGGRKKRNTILCGTVAQMKINRRRKFNISVPNQVGTVDCLRARQAFSRGALPPSPETAAYSNKTQRKDEIKCAIVTVCALVDTTDCNQANDIDKLCIFFLYDFFPRGGGYRMLQY